VAQDGRESSRRPDEPEPLGADLIIPVLAVAFAAYFLITTRDLVWEARANGVVIGVVLIALVLMLFASVARRIATGEATLHFAPEILAWTSAQRRRLAVVVLCALFVATIGWLGTSLGLFLLMVGAMLAMGVRSWRALLAVALSVTASVYLVFIAFLGSRLPRGPVEWMIERLLGGGGP
jgi:hypothetical protein